MAAVYIRLLHDSGVGAEAHAGASFDDLRIISSTCDLIANGKISLVKSLEISPFPPHNAKAHCLRPRIEGSLL